MRATAALVTGAFPGPLRPRHAKQPVRTALASLFVSSFVLAAFSSVAFATDYTVTTTADAAGVCNVNDCSLREAIAAANLNAGADRVVLGSGLTYQLSLGRLTVTDALTIDGNGSTINGAGLDRVFDVQGQFTVTINSLTITGGVASGFLSLGGGLGIRGATVVLNNCTVTGNSTAVESGTRDDGGGIAVIGSYNPATGMATLASLTLNGSTVSNNTGASGGGVVCVLCSLTISSSAISGNTAAGGDGGGIVVVGNSSALAVTGSAVVNNAVSGGAARGGGLSVPFGSSVTTLSRDRIASNTGTAGSAIFNSFGTITAVNNWWGCNFGPGAVGAGCPVTPNGVSGAVTTGPYLILKASASPVTVTPGGSSAMTADLTFNSSNVDTSPGGTVPGWTVAAFSGTLGTFATPSLVTTNGKATDVYTSGGAPGTASLSAVVDGQTVSASLLIASSSQLAISSIANTPIRRNAAVMVNFIVANLGSGAVSASSSDTTLVPNANLVVGGSGASRTLAVTPMSNQIGTTTIEVTASVGGMMASTSFVLIVSASTQGDFDGDAKADLTVFRPSTGHWFTLNSSTNYTTSGGASWGLFTDVPVPGDYDGDGKVDPAVYRPSTGQWFILQSSTGYTTFFVVTWGISTDVPVPGDYDGDGRADAVVYRPLTGQWFVLTSSSNYTASIVVAWGVGTDVPLQGDYDGDGRADLAVYRPSTGQWFILTSSSGYTMSIVKSWGVITDIPVPGDYDGDGRADLAVYRPSTGQWFILQSSTGFTAFVVATWGVSTDVPVPGDYDGDGRADPAVYRPLTGQWFVLQSSTGYTTSVVLSWGVSSDVPIDKAP
jgi:CSLREA domain-containing protein